MPDQELIARLTEKKAKIMLQLEDVDAAMEEALAAPDAEPEAAVIEGEIVTATADSADGSAEVI